MLTLKCKSRSEFNSYKANMYTCFRKSNKRNVNVNANPEMQVTVGVHTFCLYSQRFLIKFSRVYGPLFLHDPKDKRPQIVVDQLLKIFSKIKAVPLCLSKSIPTSISHPIAPPSGMTEKLPLNYRV
jgi:hypothetical protein